MPRHKKEKAQASPAKLLVWTAVATFVFALIGLGELMEDMLRAARNNLHTHRASGDIVLVKIDDKAVREIGRWPWPRSYHAELTDRLTAAGAKRIFFDVTFESASNPKDDRRLAEAFARSKRVVLPVRAEDGGVVLPQFARHVQLASINAKYNYHNAVWKIPYAAKMGDQVIPSLAAALAGREESSFAEFPLDYSLDPTTIPALSAERVLTGKP